MKVGCFTVLFAALMVGTIAALPVDRFQNHYGGESGLLQRFIEFMNEHEKIYEHDEFMHRFEVFKQNLMFIFNHNQIPDLSYTVGVNRFADLTQEEFRETFGGYQPSSLVYRSQNKFYLGSHNNQTDTNEASVNWVNKGGVTPVKDQGQCGSCWAFSTTGTMEGAYFVAHGELLSFSEQQLVDCDHNGDMGCNGGLPSQAIQYVAENGGIEGENDYHYTAADGRCKFDKSDIRAKFSGFKSVTSNNNKEMMNAVAQQPVSIAINAMQQSFQFYTSGVYDDPSCPSSMQDLDHAVLTVGYGSETGKDYWLVKNSWSSSWGDEGYIKMAKGDNVNTCGLLNVPVYPVAV
jgi:cathepsin L